MNILDKVKSFFKYTDNQLRRFLWGISLYAEYIALQHEDLPFKADIVVAGLPVYGVIEEGHASSDEIMKYRSIGGIFLAHQKGGKRTFKFKAKLFGPNRFLVLQFFKALLITGKERLTPVSEIVGGAEVVQDTVQNLINPTQTSTEKYIQNYQDWEKEEIAYHKTFPIITPTRIYLNMYLETLRYREDIRLGLNCIEVDCAFREFVAPTQARIVYNDKTKRGTFMTYISEQEKNAFRRVDLMTTATGVYFFQIMTDLINGRRPNDFKWFEKYLGTSLELTSIFEEEREGNYAKIIEKEYGQADLINWDRYTAEGIILAASTSLMLGWGNI